MHALHRLRRLILCNTRTHGRSDDDEQFDLLPGSAQAMYIAAMFDMEVQNGGLCQFFVNCGSPHAQRVADSLKAIGLEPMGILYESFLSDNQIDPSDLSSFQCETAEDYAAQYGRYPFDNFDSPYTDLWEKLRFNDAMLLYATHHPEAFEQP